MGEVGGRIVGFVGDGNGGLVGRYGLEKQYENDLKSSDGLGSSFFAKIFESKNLSISDKASKDIVTSLEPNVMKYLNTILMEMKEKWGSDEASAIVMDAHTGEILGMETVPEFNPNNYKDYDIKNFKNPSVQGVYELGSIMKPITMAAGIEERLVTPQTVFHDYGFVKIDNYTIKNFDEKVRGDVTMQDIISQSLNTGVVYVQRLLGKEKFKDNFKKFGLEDTTGIDFPGEVINKTDNLDGNTDVNFATASFGQGVAITPISMLSALAILPNDGKTMCPHFLVSKIFQDASTMDYECENAQKTVVSTSTAQTMKQMLVELIDTGLANGRFKDKNYKVGAKTGTAQLPSPDGKYYKDKFIHSYFTFFPSENPKFAVLIYQVNPKKGLLASITLAPFASQIKDFLLTYYSVPPDRQ
jgi:cell division protein FtsI/penicillin-binding protein 2